MNLKITERAQRRVKFADAWWREHRPEAPTRFVEELDWAKREMLSRPNLAPRYETASGKACRRLLLPTTEQHILLHRASGRGFGHRPLGLGCSPSPRPEAVAIFSLVALREGD